MPDCMKINPERQPDMSGEAVLSRLRLVGELNELCRFPGSSELASLAKQPVVEPRLPDADQSWMVPENDCRTTAGS
jgi:hypothetical protein